MKKTLLLLAVVALFASQNLIAQDSAAMMKAWTAYMTPGPEQQKLALLEGDFTCDMTFWDNPDKPMKNTGNCTNKMIMGGRYLESRYSGNMMGTQFEGLGTLGFDNAIKTFIDTWIDNMGTGITVLEGHMIGADILELKGQVVDPMTGRRRNVRQTLKWVDANHHTLEMFHEMNGKEVKTMQINLTRK
ncbi:DUF1579 domain-containing protein [Chitinophaga silvatica]|nr:DUF1579 domain-containing protein [Chitinophaga silvatica]